MDYFHDPHQITVCITHIKLYITFKNERKRKDDFAELMFVFSVGRYCVRRCVSPLLRPYILYIHVHKFSLDLPYAGICVLLQDGRALCSACLSIIYIYILFDRLWWWKKKHWTNKLKKKNPTWVFWDGKNWQKSNEMKIYGWYKKQNKWIFFFIVYFFIKWFVELKEKLILVLWLVRCCK